MEALLCEYVKLADQASQIDSRMIALRIVIGREARGELRRIVVDGKLVVIHKRDSSCQDTKISISKVDEVYRDTRSPQPYPEGPTGD